MLHAHISTGSIKENAREMTGCVYAVENSILNHPLRLLAAVVVIDQGENILGLMIVCPRFVQLLDVILTCVVSRALFVTTGR